LAVEFPVVTSAVRRASSLVFPGSARRVTEPDLVATLRQGEELLATTTSRGEHVAVVRRPPEAAPRYRLFLYGNGMVMADTAPIRAVLADGGAGVLCVDYLGYGLSEPARIPTETGCYRAAHAALDLLSTRFAVASAEVDVVGWSLGSAVALQVASRRPVRRLVLMSPFAGIAPFVAGQVRLDRALTRSRLGRFGPFAGAGRVRHVTAPTLLITGGDDVTTPPWMASDLQAGLPAGTELVRVPGAGHNDLFSQPVVWRRVLEFLR
jgi:pimeloyl-ACP methyl ester carboxylesterase